MTIPRMLDECDLVLMWDTWCGEAPNEEDCVERMAMAVTLLDDYELSQPAAKHLRSLMNAELEMYIRPRMYIRPMIREEV